MLHMLISFIASCPYGMDFTSTYVTNESLNNHTALGQTGQGTIWTQILELED